MYLNSFFSTFFSRIHTNHPIGPSGKVIAQRYFGGWVEPDRVGWDWRFGSLPPGRYMFICPGMPGCWYEDEDNANATYLLVEFDVTPDTPEYLPPLDYYELHERKIRLVEYRNIQPSGVTLVIENMSQYDIDLRPLVSIAPTEGELRPAREVFTRVDADMMFLPGEEQIEIRADWTGVVGELPPGEYMVDLRLGGFAHPPNPIGWANGYWAVIRFEKLCS
ncbi:MAG: hypothetical protein FWE42_06650 [Defluviitaleaceae bacterium]|nr:hypothetical protein [Defluviitaleaceae bacterium]